MSEQCQGKVWNAYSRHRCSNKALPGTSFCKAHTRPDATAAFPVYRAGVYLHKASIDQEFRFGETEKMWIKQDGSKDSKIEGYCYQRTRGEAIARLITQKEREVASAKACLEYAELDLAACRELAAEIAKAEEAAGE